MANVSWETFSLPNLQIYTCRLPEAVMQRLWGYIHTAESKAVPCLMNNKLAGNIDSSHYLHDVDDYFIKFLTPCLNAYRDDCHYNLNAFGVSAYISDDEKDFKLKGFWSNRQFKHEFNPFHSHTGILSFVVWMKIPTESEHQHNLPVSANSNTPVSSDFQFLYQNIIGNNNCFEIPMGKDKEGIVMVFPSQLHHQVYPFYECDDARVTISGNLSW